MGSFAVVGVQRERGLGVGVTSAVGVPDHPLGCQVVLPHGYGGFAVREDGVAGAQR